MHRILRAVLFILLAGILTSPFLSGCTAPCTYPDQRAVVVRIINAMADMPVITVFINGKVFVKDYAYDPPPTDLYATGYPDGTPVAAGDSSVFVVTSDALGKDTVARGRILLNFNRQTIVVMGRGHIKPPMKPTALVLRLDDEIDQPNGQTLIRSVNAVPDLDSLDIYFKSDASGTPDATLHYGKVYPHLQLTNVKGITVTEAGHPNNVIFSFPSGLPLPGVFVTAIIRGETKPLGTDFTAAPLVISDVSPGIFLYVFKTFFVRMINASREQQLSLLLRSTYITLNGENTNPPRNNYPGQNVVLNINAGTPSDYMPLNINNDSIAGFWLCKTPDSKDSVASSVDHAKANIKYSKIAVEENAVGQSGTNISYWNLPDTMTFPSGNFGRVRVIDLSPDHSSISVTIGGKTVVMHKKDILFFDLPAGNQSVTLQDGTTSSNPQINVSPTVPMSVYILPEPTTGPPLPIVTSLDD